MARAYFAVSNYRKGWRGQPERHRLSALGIPSGRRPRSRYSPSEILALQQAAVMGEMQRPEEYLPPQFVFEEEVPERFGEEGMIMGEMPGGAEGMESEELSETLPGQDVGARFMPQVEQASPAAPQLYARKRFR